MKQNKFGELVFSESDLCDLVMRGHNIKDLRGAIVDASVSTQTWPEIPDIDFLFAEETAQQVSETDYHKQKQSNWHMPESYKNLDIAKHVLDLCKTETELQRCGSELLLYQERDLFDLLRYLKYLVDVMKSNQIIWGIGRGSSVSSFVLYKLGVHRIDSIYYNLDITEFLR